MTEIASGDFVPQTPYQWQNLLQGLRLSKVEEILPDFGKSGSQFCHSSLCPIKNWIATRNDLVLSLKGRKMVERCAAQPSSSPGTTKASSLRADTKEAKQSLITNYYRVTEICHRQQSEESHLSVVNSSYCRDYLRLQHWV